MKIVTRCLYAIFGAGAFATATASVANSGRELSVHGRTSESLLDLSEPFEKSPRKNKSSCARRMIALSARELEIQGLLVLEHGEIVAEYSAIGEDVRLPIWSCTKTFTAVLLGVLIKDGYLSLEETLGEIFDYDPYDAIWGGIPDAESRKELTVKSILTMTAGLSLPDDWRSDFIWPFDWGVFGGSNLVDSLGYHKLDPSRTNTYEYVWGGNLLSYIIVERAGMSPREFAELKVFPLLGITKSDYDWQHNLDGISYAWHGIFATATVLAKLGMLYRQHGLANANDTIVDEAFVLDSTKGAVRNHKYGYGWFLFREDGVDPVYPERATRYYTGGLGATGVVIDEDLGRVTAVVSNNYLPEELTEYVSLQLEEIVNDPECTFLEE